MASGARAGVTVAVRGGGVGWGGGGCLGREAARGRSIWDELLPKANDN